VKNGVWRLLVAALIAGIRPAVTLGVVRVCAKRLNRHLREPPRRREFKPVQLLG
jgi:hypothetical protein